MLTEMIHQITSLAKFVTWMLAPQHKVGSQDFFFMLY